MKALQRLLVLILLGFQMQGVKAEPHEILKFQGFEKDHCLNHRAEGSRKPMEDDSNLQFQAGGRKEKQPGEGPENPKKKQQG